MGMTKQYSIALSKLKALNSSHSELEYPILVLQYELSSMGKEHEEEDLQSMEMIITTLEDTVDVKDWLILSKIYLYMRNFE